MCKGKSVINSFQTNWPCWAPALQAGISCVWGSDAGLCICEWGALLGFGLLNGPTHP